MAWIKRNLLFVVGIAVAIALVGVGVYYVLGSMQDADTISADLDANNQKLETLVKRDTYPSQDNIDKVRQEVKRVAEFKAKAKEKFGADARQDGLDNASFKELLEGAISGLTRDADHSGVSLPEKYDFTFGEQRRRLQLAQNTLTPLTAQLQEITSICQILFSAKIHMLNGLKRTAVGTNEMAGSGEFLSKKVTPNNVPGAVSYPYEVTFQCFSSELGSVMAGFLNAPQAYVVKTINVERGTAMDTPAPMAVQPRLGGIDSSLMRRYGMQAPQPVAVAPSVTARAGEAVLDEKPLRVTIRLEVIKLSAAAPAAPKTPPAR